MAASFGPSRRSPPVHDVAEGTRGTQAKPRGAMWLSSEEILETLRMFEEQHLDVRTVTMGISLFDCCATDMRSVCERVVRKVLVSA